MKLTTEENLATVNGASTQESFKIKSSAKAFSILSSGLYSDKILAIVRELSCNAYDSHVEAGKRTVPFDVHFPTSFDPEFWIRDYGVGLDHSGVMDVYTTYFESTKQDSNDYIGALGLGSKSPFSYTDNFMVTAVKDGVKRVYSAMVKDGFPTIVKFGDDVKTDEENGVEVKLAVKREDFSKFADAGSKVYRWFDVVPNILGNKITVSQAQMKHKNIVPGADIRDPNSPEFSPYRDNRPLARQGNVVYPLTPNLSDIDEDLHSLFKAPLVVDFPIGSLDVAASREELSYIDFTNQNINKRLREVADGLEAYVHRELNKAKTDWERLRTLDNMLDNTFKPIAMKMVEQEKNLFKDVEVKIEHGVPRLIVTSDTMSSGNFSIAEYQVKVRNHQTREVRLSRLNTESEMVKKPDPATNFAGEWRKFVRIRVTDDRSVILVNDTDKKNVLARVRNYLKDERYSKVLVVTIEDDKALKAFEKSIGHGDYELVSSLPEAPARAKNTGPSQSITMLKLAYDPAPRAARRMMASDKWQWNTVSSSIEDLVKEHKPNKVLYVPLKNQTPIFGKREVYKDTFRTFVNNLKMLDIIDDQTEIIGVRKSVLKKITSDFVNFFDYAAEQINRTFDPKELKDRALKRSMTQTMGEKFDTVTMRLVTSKLPDDHELVKMANIFLDEKTAKGVNNPGQIYLTKQVISFLCLPHELELDEDLDEKGTKQWEKLLDKYPMMAYMSKHSIVASDGINDLITYIKLVDKAG